MRGKLLGAGGDGIDIEPLTASPEEVLNDEKFYGEGSEEVQNGTMPDRPAVDTSPGMEGLEDLLKVYLFKGAHIWNGESGYPEVNIPYPDLVRAIKLTADIIRNKTKVAGVTGTYGWDGDLTSETLMAGKVGYGADGRVEGGATDWGTVNQTLVANGSYSIKKGFYSDGKVAAKDLASQTEGTAGPGDILLNKTAWVNGQKKTGTIVSKGAKTYYVSGANQYIEAATYLSGTQTIKGVYTEGISANNIKKDTWVRVGDSDDHGRIVAVKGTCEGVITLPGRWIKGVLHNDDPRYAVFDTVGNAVVIDQVIGPGEISMSLIEGDVVANLHDHRVESIGVIIGFGGSYYKQADGNETGVYIGTVDFLRRQTVQISTR